MNLLTTKNNSHILKNDEKENYDDNDDENTFKKCSKHENLLDLITTTKHTEFIEENEEKIN